MVDPTKKTKYLSCHFQHLTLRGEMGVGMPTKHLLLISIHKHHKIQAEIKDQNFLMDFPTFQELQHTKAPLKEPSMAQFSPKRAKNMFQRSVAIVQWRNRSDRFWVAQAHVASVAYMEPPSHKELVNILTCFKLLFVIPIQLISSGQEHESGVYN